MKQSEKDLLLALLIDRYTVATAPTAPKILRNKKSYKRRSISEPHQWIETEVGFVLVQHLAGESTKDIANKLKLRQSQIDNLIYSVLSGRNRFTFEQFGLVAP